MTRGRRTFVSVLLGAVALAQIYAMVSYREIFPFSPFPMFSYAQRHYRASVLNAYGVTADGSEVPLMPSTSTPYTFPLDGRLLQWTFERMAQDPDRTRLSRALEDLLVRYERGRAAGRHDGPPLRSVRLYREDWTLRFDLSNRDTPDTRSLVSEYPPS